MTRKINAEWHNANRMPRNPTHEQRMQWHLEHSKNCDCYPMTPKIAHDLEVWKAEHLGAAVKGPS
ncbi:MAG: hypothetical protein AB7P33_00915 [Dehalococcoidia bacterium]